MTTTRANRGGWIVAAFAIAAAWIAFDLLVWGYGEPPRELTAMLVRGTWGTAYGAGQVLFKATPTNGIGPVMENLQTHLEHQCRIERDGILVAAGPHWTDDEKYWDGEGMFVIRATSLVEARELAASDPMHQCGARSFVVRPWLVNEGSLQLRVSFSDGRMTLA